MGRPRGLTPTIELNPPQGGSTRALCSPASAGIRPSITSDPLAAGCDQGEPPPSWRPAMKRVLPLLLFCALAAFARCASTGPVDPNAEKVRRIVALGALIALDVDAIRDGGATTEEKLALKNHAAQAVALVGIDSQIGQTIGALAAEYAAGASLDEQAWKAAARVLLEWASREPTPGGMP